jgi:GcrA cell cycle regulator
MAGQRWTHAFAWDDNKVAQLKELHEQRMGFREIAQQLDPTGALTKNACIGKAQRLGLAQRRIASPRKQVVPGSIVKPTRQLQRVRLKPKAKPAPLAMMASSLTILADRMRDEVPGNIGLGVKTLMELDNVACRWPVGDPRHAGFHFCGRERSEGLSYCDYHHARGVVPRRAKGKEAAA